MSFVSPGALWLLLVIPAALALYAYAQRRRTQYAVRFTNLDLLADVADQRPGWRRHLPPAAYLLALAALVLAVARPEATLSVEREQATVVLVTDISASMKATDVDPTRLAAAQRAATRFLEVLPDPVRVGIVSFSDGVQTLLRPTAERDPARRVIRGLQTRRGTAMGDAIEQALDDLESSGALEGPDRPRMAGLAPGGGSGPSLAAATPVPLAQAPGSGDGQGRGERPPASILLLSDGESTTGSSEPLEAAERARRMGVPVYTVALGTDEGEVTVPDNFGQLQTVPVPPDRSTLREIAELTGGAAFAAPTEEQLRSVYERLSSQLGEVREPTEITAAFAGAALVLVLAGAALSVHWFSRFP